MKIPARLKLAAALAVALVGFAPNARAHSFPEQETPAAGATLASPPTQVTIKYDAPLERLFDSLQVIDVSGKNLAAGPPQVSADGYQLSVPVTELSPGDYTVKWRVVCIDTHHTEGSYSFSVRGSKQ